MVSILLQHLSVWGLLLVATTSAVLFPSTASDSSPSSQQQLFAVIGGQNCATNLTYGPQAITESGSADGKHPYFFSTNTASKDVPHTEWLQIVTSDGTNELFRIYWSFRTTKTLAQRFEEASPDINIWQIEDVDYRVEVTETGESYTSRAPWMLALDTSDGSPFQTNETKCCFSRNVDWGSGSMYFSDRPAQFWGIRNGFDGDSTDCHIVRRFVGGDQSYPSAKSYMYYFAPPPPYTPPASSAIDGTQRLFALLGDVCLVNLYYGPQAITEAGSADGLHPYYLSTRTPDATVAHSHWLQVVTSDGVNELFRVYWYFRTVKTLAQRIEETTDMGEMVDFRVEVAGTNETHHYSARWLFAPQGPYPYSYPFPYDVFNGGVPASRFDIATTEKGFSRERGTWGTGWAYSKGFWGVYDDIYGGGIGGCSGVVVRNGQPDRTVPRGFKSHMYYFSPTTPTTTPTLAPTVSATTVRDQRYELFAVLNGTHCATNLTYGPSAISVGGEVGGTNGAYLSTNTPHKNQRHKEWLQIVTSDGVTELFRVYWTFQTARTLEEHFTVAVTGGENVNYRVVTVSGETIHLWSKWFFSSRAGDMAAKFAAAETTNGFSDEAGMWGAGSRRMHLDGIKFPCVDPNDPSSHCSGYFRDFWGLGSMFGEDRYCHLIHQNGESAPFSSTKTYMSYAVDTRLDDKTPTTAPTAIPPTTVRTISMSVAQRVDGVSHDTYLTNQDLINDVFKATIVASTRGITTDHITDLIVSPVTARRSLLNSVTTHLRAGDKETLADAIYLQYTLTVPITSGLTFAQLSQHVTDSVQNDKFTGLLKLLAAMQNVPELSSASSSSVDTRDLNSASTDDGDAPLSTAAIIGIVVGGCAALALLVCAVVWYRHQAKGAIQPQMDVSQDRAAQLLAVQKSPIGPARISPPSSGRVAPATAEMMK